jgi:toxin ParE1/3/4
VHIVLHSEAAEDLNAAVFYYTSQANQALGLALIAEFERVSLLLASNKELGVPWVANTRRFSLRRFPFMLAYRFTETQLTIIALAHQRRKPHYWQART